MVVPSRKDSGDDSLSSDTKAKRFGKCSLLVKRDVAADAAELFPPEEEERVAALRWYQRSGDTTCHIVYLKKQLAYLQQIINIAKFPDLKIDPIVGVARLPVSEIEPTVGNAVILIGREKKKTITEDDVAARANSVLRVMEGRSSLDLMKKRITSAVQICYDLSALYAGLWEDEIAQTYRQIAADLLR